MTHYGVNKVGDGVHEVFLKTTGDVLSIETSRLKAVMLSQLLDKAYEQGVDAEFLRLRNQLQPA